jgi:hypothetical protein
MEEQNKYSKTEETTNPQISASESLENQGLQEPEIGEGTKGRTLDFQQVNEVTWKLTDGRGSIAWSGDRSGGYRTTRAIAWLMGVGNGQWIVRYRHRASKPMRSAKAKAYALEMVRGIWAGKTLTDSIQNLHQETLKTMGESPTSPAPLNIMGGKSKRGLKVDRETIAEILRTECPVLVDAKPLSPALPAPPPGDYPITYDCDGYPVLPACLDRRTKPR